MIFMKKNKESNVSMICVCILKYNVSTTHIHISIIRILVRKIYLNKERYRHISHAFGQIKTDTHTCTAVKFKKRLSSSYI